MILKLLKKAESQPGVTVSDKNSGLSMVIDEDDGLLVSRHGVPRLRVHNNKVLYSNILTQAELRAFQTLLNELKIQTTLLKGENNDIQIADRFN